MFYNYIQAQGGVFFRYLNGYEVTYFNEDTNCRPKDLTPDQMLELGVFTLQIVSPPYYNPITQELILTDAVLVDGIWTQVYAVVALDPEQIVSNERQARFDNKTQASSLLLETDWTTIPDVSDPAISDPYLVNTAEFVAYRNELRKIAVNPPVVATFPIKPANIWSE